MDWCEARSYGAKNDLDSTTLSMVRIFKIRKLIFQVLMFFKEISEDNGETRKEILLT
jgi:hypothetical protein